MMNILLMWEEFLSTFQTTCFLICHSSGSQTYFASRDTLNCTINSTDTLSINHLSEHNLCKNILAIYESHGAVYSWMFHWQNTLSPSWHYLSTCVWVPEVWIKSIQFQQANNYRKSIMNSIILITNKILILKQNALLKWTVHAYRMMALFSVCSFGETCMASLSF